MTEPLPDTWHSRDLPVLRTVVRMYDEKLSHVAPGQVETATGLSRDDVNRAAAALRQAGLVDAKFATGNQVMFFSTVSAEARRLTGAWPTPDGIADKLLAALADLAEYGDDPVEKSRAKKALEALGGFSRDTLISVIGAAAGVAMQ